MPKPDGRARTAQESLAALEHCLAKGRIDHVTRRALERAAAYERVRLEALGA